MSEVKAPSGYAVEQVMSAWQAARARLLDEDPELQHDEAALSEILGPKEGDVRDVLSRVLRAAVHADSMADAASARVDAMQLRKARYQRRSDAMRALGFAVLDALGERKIELADLTATIRAGREQVIVTDLDAVPNIYVEEVTTRKPDKATILSVLKSGGEVPGCERANGLPSLSIRTK
jgi:hypothetical protein